MTPTAGSNKVYILNYEYEDLSFERDRLAAAGLELVPAHCPTEEDVAAIASDAVGIINVYASIRAVAAAALTQCRVIVRPGVGYDMIDVAACRSHGIEVCNVPDYCTEEVADHAVALAMALQRKIVLHHRNVAQGAWNYQLVGPVHRLSGLTVGLAGFGRIGRAFAARMAGMTSHLIAYDPFVSDETFDAAGVRRVDLETLLAESDILSLHMPLTPQNHHMVSAASIATMARRPIIVNVSRGGLIDTAALVDALRSGAVAAAGLDVLESEPEVPPELLALENVIITPHTAMFSEEAMLEDRTRAVDEVIRVVQGEPPRNPVPA
jgi:D-3-phosphoglycerate dehydrogenase